MIWSRRNREYLPQWNERSKRNKEEVRQLEVNDLIWIVGENVKRAHYKMGRVRSALVKTEDGKLKRPVVKLAPNFYESVFLEKTGPAMLAPVISSKETRFRTCRLRNKS